MGVSERERRLPIGAEPGPGGVAFRVWAPRRRRVAVVIEGGAGPVTLTAEPGGYFSGRVPGTASGTRYRFQLDDDEWRYPDPASRYQPEGPHGPSEVVDPAAFEWTDGGWRGLTPQGQVVYELHVGTFTPEGTWAAAAEHLAELRDVGVTVVEVMPVADFPGRFGWGYDGVDLFAPTRLYGTPDDMRRFVDRAHALGLGVILDVVYNHLGPDGNYLLAFSENYLTHRRANDWGQSIDFDGPESGPVREFYVANAEHWIREYHLDGFRFDATQQIIDESPEHVLALIAHRARAAADGRGILLIAESEPEDTRLVRPPAAGGFGYDTIWNDDFHHSARVALTGQRVAYFRDFSGRPQEFVSVAKHGLLFQGQVSAVSGGRRGGSTAGLPPWALVNFIQNHDQVANSGHGLRPSVLAAPGCYRAMTALLLLLPGTPMLFQGQEFGATTPFLYFADHGPELAPLVRTGRGQFLSQFPNLGAPSMRDRLADPSDPGTFLRSTLSPAERASGDAARRLHRDLLAIRRETPALRGDGASRVDGAVLDAAAFLVRFFSADGEDRLLLVNLGTTLTRGAAEPLLAPPAGREWHVVWSSEDPAYGGDGTPAFDPAGIVLPGMAALLLAPAQETPAQPGR